MERWWQSWYAHFVGFLARRSWRTCVHGKDLVLNLEGPYPMCAMCVEQVLRKHADELLEQYAAKIVELSSQSQMGKDAK